MSRQVCCLKSCRSIIQADEGRIEVQTTAPGKGFTKNNPKFLVNWQRNGEACFHVTCWESILKSSRARNKKNIVFPSLTENEKQLIKIAAKTFERHDAESVFTEESKCIAEMIKKAKCCVCFTGAGISTSAGIGDYRGKSGKWTEMDREKLGTDELATNDDNPASKRRKIEDEQENDEGENDSEDGVAYEKLRPTYTHEALYKLMDDGYLKYCISQNGDGLHLLSGIPMNKISELHGNVFIEKCEKCSFKYERKSYVMDDVGSQYFEEKDEYGRTDIKKPAHAKQCDTCGLSHRTGRKCVQKNQNGKVCNGYLMDTIINFGDLLDREILDEAYEYAFECDLMLCLGTTLTVTPANELVEVGKRPLRIVVCNRQKTHMDKEASNSIGSRVFGDCDRLFRLVMRHLYKKKDIEKWEAGREKRMNMYDSQREETSD